MLLTLLKSIFTTDVLILVFAGLTLLCLFYCRRKSREIRQYVRDWEVLGEVRLSKYVHSQLRTAYSLFTTMISIFPLLGMFGTVWGLLGMDQAGGDMSLMQGNFFGALTSTAWGIIFSIVFKLIHALVRDDLEDQIEASQQMAATLGELPERRR